MKFFILNDKANYLFFQLFQILFPMIYSLIWTWLYVNFILWSPIIQLSFYHCLSFLLWYLIHCSGTSYLMCTLLNSLNRVLYKIIVRITIIPFTWFKMWKNPREHMTFLFCSIAVYRRYVLLISRISQTTIHPVLGLRIFFIWEKSAWTKSAWTKSLGTKIKEKRMS